MSSILQERQRLSDEIRQFFRQRDFVEVSTPVAATQAIPELHIELFQFISENRTWYLQASPEMAMKELLCQGSGAIFQIAPAFRAGDDGKQHSPEFTMLEWYRPGDDMQRGMQIVVELACEVLGCNDVEELSYREAFLRAGLVDPFTATTEQLHDAISRHAPSAGAAIEGEQDRDELLNVLLSHCVEPTLGLERPELVFHFPSSQCALAKVAVDEGGRAVAERFELYSRGIELGNGYHELTAAAELRERLETVNRARQLAGREAIALPERLLALMQSPGLPPCAGTAVGFERLLMARLGVESIADVIA